MRVYIAFVCKVLFSRHSIIPCITMPDFAYGGTVTFDSNMTIEEKLKRIEQFPVYLSQFLFWSKVSDTRYYLAVSKEYHKVDGEDDPDAPHLHFILYTQSKIPTYRVRAVLNGFKNTYGRSQFYLMTHMKTVSYARYIVKDVEENDLKFGGHHYYEMNLEQPYEEFSYEEDYGDYDEDY